MMVTVQPLRTWRINAGLSQPQLAHLAGLANETVAQAERGDVVRASSAKKIADALSRHYGFEIKVTDLEGLNVR